MSAAGPHDRAPLPVAVQATRDVHALWRREGRSLTVPSDHLEAADDDFWDAVEERHRALEAEASATRH